METGLRKGSAVGEAALDCGEISKGGGIENCGGWEVKEHQRGDLRGSRDESKRQGAGRRKKFNGSVRQRNSVQRFVYHRVTHAHMHTHALLVHKESHPDLRLGCLVIFRMSVSWASSTQSSFEYAQASYRLAILPQSDGVRYVKNTKTCNLWS